MNKKKIWENVNHTKVKFFILDLEENFLVTKPLNASKNSLNNLSFRVLYDLSQKIYDDKNAI
jgi:hypothetical protein